MRHNSRMMVSREASVTRFGNALHRRESSKSCSRPSSDAVCEFGRYWAAAKKPRVGGYRGIGRCWRRNQGPRRTAGSTGERETVLYHTPAAGRARARKKPEQVIWLTPWGALSTFVRIPVELFLEFWASWASSWRRRRSGPRVE
jgi:hypothetical protein